MGDEDGGKRTQLSSYPGNFREKKKTCEKKKMPVRVPHCPRCDGYVTLLGGSLGGDSTRYTWSCRDCGKQWTQNRTPNDSDRLLQRMDPKLNVARYIRQRDDLPKRIDALRRLFRAALWAVRMQPTYARRIAALASMNMLPLELKANVLGFANLLRTTPPHSRIKWPTRASPPQIEGIVLMGPGGFGDLLVIFS